MIASLPLFHQVQGRKVLLLGDGEAAEPKHRLIERAGGVVITDMQQAVDEGVRLAFVAYESAEACEKAATKLREAGVLVNVVDRPDMCDFTTPSILDRNPLLIAIGTGGASAGLAKHVRLRLEELLPQSLGRLARALSAAKVQLRKQYPDSADRRRAVDAALCQGGALDPLKEGADQKVTNWLEASADQVVLGVQSITLRSDDPEELTLRQARLLGVADRLVLDGAIASEVLARARADAERITIEDYDKSPPANGQTVIISKSRS